MSTQTDLAELYTTFFNRAPDAAGLDYWVNEVSTGQLTLAQVAQNWMTQQPEGQTSFPSSLTDAQFIDKIYDNILDRTPDSAGAQYWLDQLANGTLTRDSFALSLINGAKANTSAQGVLDSALVSNKATVGVAYADKGLNDTALAAKVLTSVTADGNSLSGTLAIISLIPSATADQSTAVLASATQLLTNLANLVASAPGEVADASTYLQTLVSNATSTTNIVTLLDNANTLLTSAASNPAALDNPAAQGAAAVVVATPSTGGGGTTPATFVVESGLGGELTFSGTATGAITITMLDATHVTFTREGITTASTLLSSNTVINIPNDAITISAGVATTLSTLGVKFATTDVITVAGTGAALAGLTFADYATAVLGGASVVLDASDNQVILGTAKADELIASGLKFATTDVITLTGTGTALAGLTFATYATAALGGASVVLNASDNAVSLTKAGADLLVASGLKFASGDVITLTDTGAALGALTFTNYGIAVLGGTSVVLNASDNAVSLTTAQADALIASGLTFAATDVITLTDTGTALAGLTFATYATAVLGGASVVLDASGNAVSLTKAQADLLLASGLTFAATDVITLTGTAVDLAALEFADYTTNALGGASVELHSSTNAVSLSVSQAQDLLFAGLTFATTDAITLTGLGTELAGFDFANFTDVLGGASVVLDASDDAVSLTSVQATALSGSDLKFAATDAITVTGVGTALAGLVYASLKTSELGGSSVVLDASDDEVILATAKADELIASGLKFATSDVITLADTGAALAGLTFADYETTVLGGASVVLNASDDAVSLTTAQAEALIASDLTFANTDVITLTGTGTALAGLTFGDYTAANLGGSSVVLDATTAVSLTNAQATALTASALKFATDDAVTITVDTANEGTALTAYTTAAIGGSGVTLDAADDAWTVSAAALSTAAQAGTVLADADVVTITNDLLQGAQTISAGFQTLNDKLSFVGQELFNEAGYVEYVGLGTQLTAGDFTAKLLVGAGVIADEAVATFTFDTTSNVLSYDADGTGSGTAIALLTLTGVTSLSTTDFVISAAVGV